MRGARNTATTLCALLSAGFFSCAMPEVRDAQPPLVVPAIEGGFDHSNVSVADTVRQEAYAMTEQIVVEAEYRFTLPDGEEETGIMRKRGSGVVLDDHHALTAYHVVHAPRQLSILYVQAIKDTLPSLDVSLTQELELQLQMGTAELVSLRIMIGDVEVIDVLCPSYADEDDWPYDGPDYALLSLPKGHGLPSLARSPHVHLGTSEILEIGDYLYAIGYSLGQGRFLSEGLVSNVQEFTEESVVRDLEFTLTTPISPGNSGGPAFAVYDGELYLIGLTVATFTNAQNLNIAVGISRIFDDMEKNYGLFLRQERPQQTNYQ